MKKMLTPTVFLSGPMRCVARKDTVQWRLKTRSLLPHAKIIDPMRGRRDHEIMPNARLAVCRDFLDVRSSDVILVSDIFIGVPMVGTAMEIHFAKTLGKMIIAFGDANRDDYFLSSFIDFWFDSLEEACSFIETAMCNNEN